MRRAGRRPPLLAGLLVALALVAVGCSPGDDIFFIGGIPDQDVSMLKERFDKLARYLSDETGVETRYVPSVAYSAVVTAFKNGGIQMGWFGGLTGVQARLTVPGAKAIAQRAGDERFRSVFVARPGSDITSLGDLRDKSVTFGSPSSTSGHLMPRLFLTQAGLDPEKEFAVLNYSGSHDKTWKLVESGAYDAGALSAIVWQTRVDQGRVDLSKVDVFYTSPPYADYHWLARPDLDARFGDGFTERVRQALLSLRAGDGVRQEEIMAAFQTDRFIPTANENYDHIEDVARTLGIIEG